MSTQVAAAIRVMLSGMWCAGPAMVGQRGGAKAARERERMLALTVQTLRGIRLGIRELGLEPSDLPAELKWLAELED
jgi:hypothetical protein